MIVLRTFERLTTTAWGYIDFGGFNYEMTYATLMVLTRFQATTAAAIAENKLKTSLWMLEISMS